MRVRAGMIVAVALASASCVFAQFPGGDGPGPGGGGPGGGGRGGDMRGPGGMMGGDGVEQAKAALKATDEEWQVLRPAIQKVVNARRTADAGLVSGQPRGMFGGRGGRGGPGGPGGMGNDSFNGPNNSGPGGRGNRGGGGGGGPPTGDGTPPVEPGNNNGGQPPANGQGGGQGGPGNQRGQNQQQDGNRQNNNAGPNGGPNAGGPPGMMAAPTGAVGTAMNELKTAAGKDGVKAAELNAKIAAVRAERKKARDALGGAVDELKALVTPEQEAMLIALGFLE